MNPRRSYGGLEGRTGSAWIECPLFDCRVFWYADEAIKGHG
jgi:hypothetical protein